MSPEDHAAGLLKGCAEMNPWMMYLSGSQAVQAASETAAQTCGVADNVFVCQLKGMYRWNDSVHLPCAGATVVTAPRRFTTLTDGRCGGSWEFMMATCHLLLLSLNTQYTCLSIFETVSASQPCHWEETNGMSCCTLSKAMHTASENRKPGQLTQSSSPFICSCTASGCTCDTYPGAPQ